MFTASHRLKSRIAFSLGAALLAAAITASVASAHARYESSNPPNGGTLNTLPASLQITFTEELASIRIDVTGPDGSSATTGPATIDLAERKNASVPLRSAGAGKYSVVWHNVSGDDGDPNDGAFEFTVAGASAAPAGGGQPATSPAAAATPAPAAAAAPSPATGDDAITPGIHDVRLNTYRKRQAIRDQYRGKINEVAFNEAVADDQGLESALKAATGSGSSGD
jgi:copper resistance protein C